MLVSDVEAKLFEVFPAENAEAWDNVGLLVGDAHVEVTGIACALDPTPRAIVEAAKAGCNVLVTHHPVALEMPKRILSRAEDESGASEAIYQAIAHGVSLIAMHTNLDCSPAAIALAGQMTGLEVLGAATDDGYGALLDARALTVDEVSYRFAEAFGALPQVWGAGDTPAGLVAYCSGSFGEMAFDAYERGAHTIVTGELSYHRAQDLIQRGAAAILIGHDVSELPYARMLCQTLAEFCDTHLVTLAEAPLWHVCLEA